MRGGITTATVPLATLKTMPVVLFLVACCLGQDRGGSAPSYANDISKILGRERLSGSLEYWGVCDWRNFVPDLPKIRSGSGKEISAVDEIGAMFEPDSMMQVTQEKDGKVRMVERDVPDDLLSVKIHHLVFPAAEYSAPAMAMMAILKTPEVQNFRVEHKIGPKADWGPGFSFEGPMYKSSVRGELNDVTVAEALDYVLQTYPGYWLYENCRDKDGARIVYFGFYVNPPPYFYESLGQARH